MSAACYSCGRAINEPKKAVAVLVVESHTGRLGSALLHADCCCQPNLVRYRQTIVWEATISNLTGLKQLHHRLADRNGSRSGSVPIMLT